MKFFKPNLLKTNITFGSSLLVLLLLTIPLAFLVSQRPQELRQHATGNTLTFTPTVIPLSAPEIGNPWRGPVYYGSESPPPNWPLIDHYNRWCWSEIEPTEGEYNLS